MSAQELHYEVLPVTRFRSATAKRLRISISEKPPVTLHRTIEALPLFARLAWLRSNHQCGEKPTLTSALTVLLARVLSRDPVMNSCLQEDELRRYDEVHLAVAVATDNGLVSPVLRPVDVSDDHSAARALARLGELARNGDLRIDHLAPSTFTLTNLGPFGIEYFTPILNPPHVGILGVGRSPSENQQRLPLSLTFDHAAVDGVDGARFLQALADEIRGLAT
jgi:pyruvate dehydrogenase E2 component (dihydrolipoamide acetyltransferase)